VGECCQTYGGSRLNLAGVSSIRGDVTFVDGMRMISTSGADATCTAAERGKVYFIGSATGDSVVMCVWNGSQYELRAMS
jgi:hypothetical protein